MSLLQVSNLKIGFKESNKKKYNIIKGISFNLEANEILGIVGESGSGKSLTALSILGLLPYPKAFHSNLSSIKYNNEELLNNSEIIKYRGNKIGFIFQEPQSALNPLHKVGKQIAESLIIHQKLSVKQAYEEALKLMIKTKIKNPHAKFNAYPHELSGGQRQRIMIAMAIANKPDILIADEPTTALDVNTSYEIIDLLKQLQKEYGLSIIFISHDLNIIRRIADKIIVMKSGKIIESGNSEQIFSHPRTSYTKTLINSFNLLKNNNYSTTSNILKLKNITVKYPLEKNFWGKIKNYFFAVNNISLNLKQGKTLGIIGESGSGKTSLAMSVVGLNNFEGNILYNSTNIKNLTNKELHKKIQIVFQDPYNSLNPRMTIADIVGEGIKVHHPEMSQEQRIITIKKHLHEVGIKDDALNKYPHEFSGGQRQRIAIARALAVEPEILILDEPTSALDATIATQILHLLQKIQQTKKLTYLFISHDIKAIKAISDDIAVMKDGKIIEINNAHKLFKHQKHKYTKKIISSSNWKTYNESKQINKSY